MEPMWVPPWLEPLLSTSFFSICEAHVSVPRNECNMYCIDCKGHSFCFYCKSIWHKDHQVIQIRRSSYHDVVRVAEIQKVLNISGVQTYVINGARVIFLNERPQPKTSATNNGKSSSHLCKICRRTLLDPFRFCSLGCKLVGTKKNIESGSLALRLASKEEKKELSEGIHKQVYQSMHPLQETCSNSRKRKGIPQRAPLRP